MDKKTDVVKLGVSIIAWCMCVITGIATVAFYKWYGGDRDWLIDLAVSFVLLTSLAFGILSFLCAVGAVRLPQEQKAKAVSTSSPV